MEFASNVLCSTHTHSGYVLSQGRQANDKDECTWPQVNEALLTNIMLIMLVKSSQYNLNLWRTHFQDVWWCARHTKARSAKLRSTLTVNFLEKNVRVGQIGTSYNLGGQVLYTGFVGFPSEGGGGQPLSVPPPPPKRFCRCTPIPPSLVLATKLAHVTDQHQSWLKHITSW